MSLGSRLRERRQQLGLTLEEVAQAVGVSKSTVQKWESGTIEDMRLAKAADESVTGYKDISNGKSPNTTLELNRFISTISQYPPWCP